MAIAPIPADRAADTDSSPGRREAGSFPHMRTAMVLDALETAIWLRGKNIVRLDMSLWRRLAVYLQPLRRTPRRDRCSPLDRHGGRQLRQHAD
jgi:hypothetical protein